MLVVSTASDSTATDKQIPNSTPIINNNATTASPTTAASPTAAPTADWITAGQALLADHSHSQSTLAQATLADALARDIARPPVNDHLLAAIVGLRRNHQCHLAMLLIDQALRTWGLSVLTLAVEGVPAFVHATFPHAQLTQLEDLVYEAALCSWYTDYQPHGLALSDLILLDPNSSVRTSRYMWRNIEYFTKTLEYEHAYDVDAVMPLIKAGSEERYRPLNPSIVHDPEGGYTLVCKGVNFDQYYGREYYVLDDDNYVRVRNFLVKLDSNFRRVAQHEIVEHVDRLRYNDQGLEDMRIVRVNNTLWFTAFTRSMSPDWVSLTVLGKLSSTITPGGAENGGAEPGGVVEVESLTLMQVVDPSIMEKNWLPFELNGELLLTYSVGPNLFVLRPDVTTGHNESVFFSPTHLDFHRFRGSAGPFEFTHNGVVGSLYVVHEVVYKEYRTDSDTTSRTYFHRFVFADDEWVVTHVSRVFIFEEIGVEFCTGIAESHQQGMVVLSVGIQDRRARLYEMSKAKIAAMLLQPTIIYPGPPDAQGGDEESNNGNNNNNLDNNSLDIVDTADVPIAVAAHDEH